MTVIPPSPLRLRLDSAALVSNWSWLAGQSRPAACGAAIKADGYGLGAHAVVRRLADAGCRDFFVATWAEAAALHPWADGLALSVLHGARAEDMDAALASPARPVLNTAAEVARWRSAGGGACDVMIDTGMNRLGLSHDDACDGMLDGLLIETLMSHLASADEVCAQNAIQHERFVALKGSIKARRYSLANSAGICLGGDYHFDLTRPGLALYGGVPRPEAAPHIRQVAFPEAQILQRRTVQPGDTIGYNATWRATRATEVAILNIGYADGYWRGFSDRGTASAGRAQLPVIGRVSMDLVAIDVTEEAGLGEGDWVSLAFALPEASARSGLSQYELLTGLGARFERCWH